MNINELVKEAHETAVDKGWWDTERNFGEQIALMHSELSEVLEDHRDNKSMTELYFEEDRSGNKKPCGIPIEFADLLIRVFDTCGRYSIDLEGALRIKMEYNKTRPYKHGKVC
jgi:NTP pyrophosphatase (non-canonical NTP hydrolase)